jgi:hypothetical protein
MGKLDFCFIRKNTHEIQERLKKLGVPQNDFDEGNRPWIAYNHGLWISVDEGHDRLFRGDIDCGDSEDLFFALITYNKDIDRNQWFFSTGWTMGPENIPIPDKWVYCNQDTLEHFAFVNNSPNSYSREIWKKATIEELIQHFKSE